MTKRRIEVPPGDRRRTLAVVQRTVADIATGGMSLVTEEVRSAAGPIPTVTYGDPRTVQLAGVTEAVNATEGSPA